MKEPVLGKPLPWREGGSLAWGLRARVLDLDSPGLLAVPLLICDLEQGPYLLRGPHLTNEKIRVLN